MMNGRLDSSRGGVQEGDVLGGKYRVERVLGVGGMGVVVAAHHIQLGERVALKFLLPEALNNDEAVARFAREAQAAARIKSEHVARVTDVGTLPGGGPYIVMEYLDGGDLASWLKRWGALPIGVAVEFVLQACVAVADAHAIGIIHRDLKPSNLFCVRRSDGQLTIKVIDFGISKVSRAGGSAVPDTRTAAVMGSPPYMSPEQMRSAKDVTAQSDIWSLGVILFELMVGRTPFEAETVTELAIKVTNEPAPSLRGFRPEIPGGLEAAVLKCLEKDRRARFRNVAELARDLLPFAPARARASVDRIAGILQEAALSAQVPAASVFSEDGDRSPAGTLPPPGGKMPGRWLGRRAIGGVGVAGALALVGFAASLAGLSGAPLAAGTHRANAQASESPAARNPSWPVDRPEPFAPTVVAGLASASARPAPALTLAPAAVGPPWPVAPGAASPPGTRAPAASEPPPRATASTTAAGIAAAMRTPSVPVAPFPTPSPRSPPSPGCDPPYYIDPKTQDRLFKKECFK
jgi:serine/threonine-protein kinase